MAIYFLGLVRNLKKLMSMTTGSSQEEELIDGMEKNDW
jgi:hypothetical protein